MANPFEQQRALASGEVVARLERGVVTVTGPDRLSWLDSMTSQSIAGLKPGESAESLLLDPNGRIEHVLRVVDDGATSWLVVDDAEAAPLAAWLDRMRFMLRVEVADRSAEFAVVGSVVPPPAGASGSDESSGERGADVEQPDQRVAVTWQDPWSAVQPGGYEYATAAPHPGDAWVWFESVVARDAVPADAVPQAAFDALRIAAWRPDWANEVDERSIPHELDWLRSAVHLDKGCYRGQETVAKVHNLGHPPRRLVFLQLDGSDSVYAAHGDPVVVAGASGADVSDVSGASGAEVGVVTSAAVHYELGPIALAVIKRSADPVAPLAVVHGQSPDGDPGEAAQGTRLAAAQEVVVPPEAGATVEVPRIPRLGAVRR